jgi:hypothetical protein
MKRLKLTRMDGQQRPESDVAAPVIYLLRSYLWKKVPHFGGGVGRLGFATG